MLSAGGRALRSQFSLLWDSLQHLGARGQRCSYSPHPIAQPRDPSSNQRGCSSGCLQMVWDEKRSFHRIWEGGDGARWEFSLRRGNPCVVSRDTAQEAAQHLLLLSALPGLGAAQEKLEKNGQGGLPLFISCSSPGCSLSWGTVPCPFSQLRAGGAQQEAHRQGIWVLGTRCSCRGLARGTQIPRGGNRYSPVSCVPC